MSSYLTKTQTAGVLLAIEDMHEKDEELCKLRTDLSRHLLETIALEEREKEYYSRIPVDLDTFNACLSLLKAMSQITPVAQSGRSFPVQQGTPIYASLP